VKPHTRSKPQQTGISNRLASTPRPEEIAATTVGPTQAEVEEIYNLPREEARVKMAALMAKAKASK